MAERLRRKIRNLLGFSRAGSSPAGVVYFLCLFFQNVCTNYMYSLKKKNFLKYITFGSLILKIYAEKYSNMHTLVLLFCKVARNSRFSCVKVLQLFTVDTDSSQTRKSLVTKHHLSLF